MDRFVELATVVRSGFVESRHFGVAVAVDPGGEVVFAAGDVEAVLLPRSTAKPLQAVGASSRVPSSAMRRPRSRLGVIPARIGMLPWSMGC
jgi:L-asparaginase II